MSSKAVWPTVMLWLEHIAAEQRRIRLGSPVAYLIAALLVLLAWVVRLVLGEELVGVPFITFFPVVVLSALVGGFGPGLLATILGAICAWVTLIPPRESLAIKSVSDALALILFFLTSILMCAVIHAFHVAISNIREARQREREFSAALEQRVAERTEELRVANERAVAEMLNREKAEMIAQQSQKLRLIGQLTGGIAHDFNNLLTIILGNLDTAQRRLASGDTEKVERLIGSAIRGGERAAVLTHRLLAFARQQALSPGTVNVNKLLNGMQELIRQTLPETVEIEMALAGGLWKTFCDPSQVETSLLNLAINARDAMPNGGKLTIETANAYLDDEYARLNAEVKPGQYVMVAVTDTGTGMTEDILAHAFEPFFTTKGIGEGTGLGLAMVYGFVKQSEGHIKIYSEPGQGTTIKIYLPRLIGEGQEEPTIRIYTPARVDAGCTILVVEDDEDVREFTARSLRDRGYAVCEASDGASALKILETEKRIDLLFTDVGLPKRSGRDIAEDARRSHPNLKVLFTTGYARNAIVHGGRLDPDVVLLPKPFTADALARKVSQLLAEEIA